MNDKTTQQPLGVVSDLNNELCGEMVALAIKAGRRASYDLQHACSFIPDADIEMRDMFYQRSREWLNIFEFDSGIKDYRHSLHMEISRMESTISQLRKVITDNGLEDPTTPIF